MGFFLCFTWFLSFKDIGELQDSLLSRIIGEETVLVIFFYIKVGWYWTLKPFYGIYRGELGGGAGSGDGKEKKML